MKIIYIKNIYEIIYNTLNIFSLSIYFNFIKTNDIFQSNVCNRETVIIFLTSEDYISHLYFLMFFHLHCCHRKESILKRLKFFKLRTRSCFFPTNQLDIQIFISCSKVNDFIFIRFSFFFFFLARYQSMNLVSR